MPLTAELLPPAMLTAPTPIAKLNRPASFAASLRGSSVQAAELRLHIRGALDIDMIPANSRCAIGFVLPKRWCKSAVRRNLIRRILRERLRLWLRQMPALAADEPALVLVFRLTQKFSADFGSARSPQLAQALQQRADQLFERLQRRLLPSS